MKKEWPRLKVGKRKFGLCKWGNQHSWIKVKDNVVNCPTCGNHLISFEGKWYDEDQLFAVEENAYNLRLGRLKPE